MSTELASLLAVVAALSVLLVLGLAQIRHGGWFNGRVPRLLEIELQPAQKTEAERGIEIAAEHLPEGLEEAKQQIELTSRIRAARVLWVDDHPENNIYENVMLSALGLAITQVTSSEAAKSLLEQDGFDLLITDLTRGHDERGGIKLLEDLSDRSIPTIVYTLMLDTRIEEATHFGARSVTKTPAGLMQAVLDRFGIQQ